MKKTAVGAALLLGLVLTGCTAQTPTRAEVRADYLKAYAAAMHLSKADAESFFGETADRAADDALKGNCAQASYRSQLEDGAQLTAWDAICAKYFK